MTGSDRMALEAIRLGVPKISLIIENKSKDTRSNVSNTTLVMGKNGWESLILVTDNYHIKRAMKLFQKKGLNVYPAPVEWNMKRNWNSNWTYLKLLSYELRAWVAYSLLSDKQIELLINFMRPS